MRNASHENESNNSWVLNDSSENDDAAYPGYTNYKI